MFCAQACVARERCSHAISGRLSSSPIGYNVAPSSLWWIADGGYRCRSVSVTIVNAFARFSEHTPLAASLTSLASSANQNRKTECRHVIRILPSHSCTFGRTIFRVCLITKFVWSFSHPLHLRRKFSLISAHRLRSFFGLKIFWKFICLLSTMAITLITFRTGGVRSSSGWAPDLVGWASACSWQHEDRQE